MMIYLGLGKNEYVLPHKDIFDAIELLYDLFPDRYVSGLDFEPEIEDLGIEVEEYAEIYEC